MAPNTNSPMIAVTIQKPRWIPLRVLTFSIAVLLASKVSCSVVKKIRCAKIVIRMLATGLPSWSIWRYLTLKEFECCSSCNTPACLAILWKATDRDGRCYCQQCWEDLGVKHPQDRFPQVDQKLEEFNESFKKHSSCWR